MTRSTDGEWWKGAVVYEIYPRSFYDADGDGVGDLAGIREKLPYLEDLGIDAVWLTPVYDSPLADFGYDVRDYREILPEFGTMDDWKRLRDGLHERGIRLVMDVVANHTSDEHEWFRQSRRAVDPYTDYYVWREGPPDEPPNNWDSVFGGPAWTYDEERGAWYLHLFDPKQPDLNWRNPDVREDVYETMRWWLERDVDGFRLDVVNFISKPEGLPDGDPDAVTTGSEHFVNGPRLDAYLAEMDERVFAPYDAMTVGEMPGVSVADARRFTGPDGPLDMVFHFQHMRLDAAEDDDPWAVGDWTLPELKETFTRWQEGLYPDGWNALYLSNHDQPRQVSRFGDDERYREASATMLATFLHTLRGTPFVYQGEELGMTNVPFDSADELADVEAIRYVERMLERPDVDDFADVRDAVVYGSRDNARTPMQWSADENAGFTSGEPWLKVNPNYGTINAEAARSSPDSIWHYYRRLVDLRADHPVLVDGRYQLLAPDHPEVYAYLRIGDDERTLTVLNFTGDCTSIDLADAVEANGAGGAGGAGSAESDGIGPENAELLIANYDVSDVASIEPLELRPYEARVYRLE